MRLQLTFRRQNAGSERPAGSAAWPPRRTALWLSILTSSAAVVANAAAADAPTSVGQAEAARLATEAHVSVFDDGAVRVIAPRVGVRWDGGGAGRFEVRAHVDALSGATVAMKGDLTTSATRFVEERRDLALDWDSPDGEKGGGVTMAGSDERDFRSLALAARGHAEGWQRRLRAIAAAGGTLEQIWLPGERDAWRPLHSAFVEIGASLILTPRWVLAFSGLARRHGCDAAVGCAASPYRAVALQRADGDRTSARERHPATRLRGAATATLSFAPRHGAGLHAALSTSGDDWNVRGVGAEVAAALDVTAVGLRARLSGHFARHSRAAFFRDVDRATAAAIPAYRSADRRLGGMSTSALALDLAQLLPLLPAIGVMQVVLHLSAQRTGYDAFPQALGTSAYLAGVGVELQR